MTYGTRRTSPSYGRYFAPVGDFVGIVAGNRDDKTA